jgi:hypothetical protein
MIWNIIDKRKNQYRWKRINAIIEPTWHDNSCQNSDQAEQEEQDTVPYEERKGVSLAEAITWATAIPYAVTLFLFDDEPEKISVSVKKLGK